MMKSLVRWGAAATLAVMAPVFAASAQTYESDAASVVGGEIAREVSKSVAATLAGGIAGAVSAGLGADGRRGVPGRPRSSPGPDRPQSFMPTDRDSGVSADTSTTAYFMGGNRGQSAGAAEKKLGVWLLGGYTDIENDFVNTAYDGDIFNIVGGIDYRFTDRVAAGIAVSYENVDIDTTFNAGTLESDGMGFSPYIVFKLSDAITADANFSYTSLEYDTTRIVGGANVTGNYDSDRYTTGVNLNYGRSFNKVFVGASLGFLYIKEEQDSYTESNGTFINANDISIGQGRLSGTLGYDMGKWQPYVMARLEKEFWQPSAADLSGANLASPSEDDFGATVGGGINFAFSDRVSGGILGTTAVGRDDLDIYTISGRVRVSF